MILFLSDRRQDEVNGWRNSFFFLFSSIISAPLLQCLVALWSMTFSNVIWPKRLTPSSFYWILPKWHRWDIKGRRAPFSPFQYVCISLLWRTHMPETYVWKYHPPLDPLGAPSCQLWCCHTHTKSHTYSSSETWPNVCTRQLHPSVGLLTLWRHNYA